MTACRSRPTRGKAGDHLPLLAAAQLDGGQLYVVRYLVRSWLSFWDRFSMPWWYSRVVVTATAAL
ncbi:hypothetical protein DIPPA_35944 [Diplonema papillatum]|nr:hypothetical protein DIPPA_35944 [Diplonema papillatum]